MALWSLAARAGIPAARSALRFLSKMKKPPKGITLYRGEPLKPLLSMKEQAKLMYGRPSVSRLTDFSNPNLRTSALGRWYTTDPDRAMRFAGYPRYSIKMQGIKNYLKNFPGWGYEPGVVKKVMVTPKQAKLAKKVQEKISGGDMMGEAYVIPKNLLPKVETDAIRTAVANLKRMMGLKHGGLARILEV